MFYYVVIYVVVYAVKRIRHATWCLLSKLFHAHEQIPPFSLILIKNRASHSDQL
jgi:hypothetical protein